MKNKGQKHHQKEQLYSSYEGSQIREQEDRMEIEEVEEFSEWMSEYLNVISDGTNSKIDIKQYEESLIRNKFQKIKQFHPKIQYTVVFQANSNRIVQIKLGRYKTICQYIVLGIDLGLQNRMAFAEGNFGKIYNLYSQNEFYVVKQLQFSSENYKEEYEKIFSQFFCAKFASALGIGPKITHPYGYDILIYNNKAHYCMEKCLNNYGDLLLTHQGEEQEDNRDIFQVNPYKNKVEYFSLQELKSRFERNLKQNLQILHQFSVVHGDIKKQNITWSIEMRKFIFLDFGLTRFLKQSVGQKTLTSFRGTFTYSSLEMQKTYFLKTPLKVDLYYNDLFALKKVINELKNYQQKQFQKEDADQEEQQITFRCQQKWKQIACFIKIFFIIANYTDKNNGGEQILKLLKNMNHLRKMMIKLIKKIIPDNLQMFKILCSSQVAQSNQEKRQKIYDDSIPRYVSNFLNKLCPLQQQRELQSYYSSQNKMELQDSQFSLFKLKQLAGFELQFQKFFLLQKSNWKYFKVSKIQNLFQKIDNDQKVNMMDYWHDEEMVKNIFRYLFVQTDQDTTIIKRKKVILIEVYGMNNKFSFHNSPNMYFFLLWRVLKEFQKYFHRIKSFPYLKMIAQFFWTIQDYSSMKSCYSKAILNCYNLSSKPLFQIFSIITVYCQYKYLYPFHLCQIQELLQSVNVSSDQQMKVRQYLFQCIQNLKTQSYIDETDIKLLQSPQLLWMFLLNLEDQRGHLQNINDIDEIPQQQMGNFQDIPESERTVGFLQITAHEDSIKELFASYSSGTVCIDQDIIRQALSSHPILSFCPSYWDLGICPFNQFQELFTQYISIFQQTPDLQIYNFQLILFIVSEKFTEEEKSQITAKINSYLLKINVQRFAQKIQFLNCANIISILKIAKLIANKFPSINEQNERQIYSNFVRVFDLVIQKSERPEQVIQAQMSKTLCNYFMDERSQNFAFDQWPILLKNYPLQSKKHEFINIISQIIVGLDEKVYKKLSNFIRQEILSLKDYKQQKKQKYIKGFNFYIYKVMIEDFTEHKQYEKAFYYIWDQVQSMFRSDFSKNYRSQYEHIYFVLLTCINRQKLKQLLIQVQKNKTLQDICNNPHIGRLIYILLSNFERELSEKTKLRIVKLILMSFRDIYPGHKYEQVPRILKMIRLLIQTQWNQRQLKLKIRRQISKNGKISSWKSIITKQSNKMRKNSKKINKQVKKLMEDTLLHKIFKMQGLIKGKRE